MLTSYTRCGHIPRCPSLPQLQPLGRVAVGDGNEPPPLSRRVEVPRALAGDPRRGPRPVQGSASAARDDHCRGQVDELIVLHLETRTNVLITQVGRWTQTHGDGVLLYLQHGLLLGARLEVALLTVNPFPLLRCVVVEVDILHPKVLLVFHLVLIR